MYTTIPKSCSFTKTFGVQDADNCSCLTGTSLARVLSDIQKPDRSQSRFHANAKWLKCPKYKQLSCRCYAAVSLISVCMYWSHTAMYRCVLMVQRHVDPIKFMQQLVRIQSCLRHIRMPLTLSILWHGWDSVVSADGYGKPPNCWLFKR